MRKSLATTVTASLLLGGALVAPNASAQTALPAGSGANENPLRDILSAESLIDWASELPEGTRQDLAQGWTAGSSVPDSLNPVELARQEVAGFGMMSSGLENGDLAQSSRGAAQVASVAATVFVAWLVLGQSTELVMRGLRTAGVEIPALTF